MPLRGTILQPWNWHSPRLDADGSNLYQRLARDADLIAGMGFTAVWLPPASQGVGGEQDVGYGIRNWYRLDGTKYGDKAELQQAAAALKANGVQVYHDQVHNHLMGGDIESGIWCLHVKCNNKNERLDASRAWFQADIPTAYPWLGLNSTHFDAYHPNGHDCWALSGKRFDREAKLDPLMGCDLDFDSIDLVRRLEAFGDWFKFDVRVDGYRFDAVKHIRPKGTLGFLHAMRTSAGRNLFAVGEYFDADVDQLHAYIGDTLGQISLFDFPLQRHLVEASRAGAHYNLAGAFERTLTREQPLHSVPFVHSHDDQPPIHGGGHRGEYVGDWFISQAYALTLLRDEGYPMVADADMLRHPALLKRYLLARHDCTFGERHDRFDHNNTVGWAFAGGYGFDNSMAVVLTNGEPGHKWLPTQRPHTRYRDLSGALGHTLTTNADGWGRFECPARATSVWVEDSKYRQLLDRLG